MGNELVESFTCRYRSSDGYDRPATNVSVDDGRHGMADIQGRQVHGVQVTSMDLLPSLYLQISSIYFTVVDYPLMRDYM